MLGLNTPMNYLLQPSRTSRTFQDAVLICYTFCPSFLTLQLYPRQKQLYTDSQQTGLPVSVLQAPVSLRGGAGVLEHSCGFAVRYGRVCGELGRIAAGFGQTEVGVTGGDTEATGNCLCLQECRGASGVLQTERK